MEEFDYTLEIEYERLSVSELQYILQILYDCSSECYIDIEYLADEVISRLRECGTNIQLRHNRCLKCLIISTFDTLKSISKYMEFPSSRIKIIYDDYQRYMHGIESPVASPVVSPISKEKTKVPKIMKKAKRIRNSKN
tara:strand:+ start:475 stop:888 length:414 start_codon:yes stop_codon:yes gene_type:complete